MSYINDGFWQKSYLLEFRKNGTIENSYTFSAPPESEDFSFPQRVNETKTYGGVIYDDYGNDTNKIILSGSTGNQQLKRIFRGNSGSDIFLNGKDEIFYLQNLLEEYGKKENLTGKEVWLYPLWSGKDDFYTVSNGDKIPATKTSSFRVLIQDFSIKRSKDNPCVFNYSISMLSIDKDYSYSSPKRINTPVGSIQKIKDDLSWYQELKNKFTDYLGSWRNYLGDVMNFVDISQEYIDDLNNEIDFWQQTLTGFSNALTDELNNTNNLITSVFNTEKKVVSYHKSISMSVVDIFSTVEKIWKNAIDMYKYTEVLLSNEENPVLNEIANAFSQTTQEFIDDFKRINGESVHTAALIYFDVSNLPDTTGTISSNETYNETNEEDMKIVYGNTEIVCSDGDSYENIAQKYFGDSSYASMLASYNSRTNELKPGDKIYVPILNATEIARDNIVLTTETKNDNYGSDIKIDNGNISVKNGDFEIISGAKNLDQAIKNRITTVLDSRVRLPGYGIKSMIGKQQFTNYVLSSIQDTVILDPRIKTVDSVSINGNGDSLQVLLTYTDINGRKNIYGGSF